MVLFLVTVFESVYRYLVISDYNKRTMVLQTVLVTNIFSSLMPPPLGCSRIACLKRTFRIGALPTVCRDGGGWISRGRSSVPLPPSECAQAECAPGTDDSQWRAVDLPHDFVVEGAFAPDADMLHGSLLFSRLFESVYLVMQISDCKGHNETRWLFNPCSS